MTAVALHYFRIGVTRPECSTRYNSADESLKRWLDEICLRLIESRRPPAAGRAAHLSTEWENLGLKGPVVQTTVAGRELHFPYPAGWFIEQTEPALEKTFMRIASSGHLVFSITMIALGIVGLLYPDFVPVWSPVPASIPGRGVLVYLGPLISLASGIGLLVPAWRPLPRACYSRLFYSGCCFSVCPIFYLNPLLKLVGQCFRCWSCWLPPGCSMSGSPLTRTINISALSAATVACVSRTYSTASR